MYRTERTNTQGVSSGGIGDSSPITGAEQSKNLGRESSFGGGGTGGNREWLSFKAGGAAGGGGGGAMMERPMTAS